MANSIIKKIPINGDLAFKKIREQYGTIKQFAASVGLGDRSIRNYITANAIPEKVEIITAFSKLSDGIIMCKPETERSRNDVYDAAFSLIWDAGFKAGYEKCLTEFSSKLESLKQ